MASTIFQAVLWPTQLFQWKLWFALSTNHVLATKFPTDFNSTLFQKTLRNCCIDTIFSKMCRTFKRRLSTYTPIHISSMGHNRGQVSDSLSDKFASLWYKTICSEKVCRNFDYQCNLVSFLVKHNQFSGEARLLCPLYRPREGICIGIYVFKCVFNVWHLLKKVCQCNNILNNLLLGNKDD